MNVYTVGNLLCVLMSSQRFLVHSTSKVSNFMMKTCSLYISSSHLSPTLLNIGKVNQKTIYLCHKEFWMFPKMELLRECIAWPNRRYKTCWANSGWNANELCNIQCSTFHSLENEQGTSSSSSSHHSSSSCCEKKSSKFSTSYSQRIKFSLIHTYISEYWAWESLSAMVLSTLEIIFVWF